MFGVRSWGLSYTPTLTPTGSRMSFHSRHADWQALQPLHLEASISLATSVYRCAGGVTVEAERRIRSVSPNFGAALWVDGLRTGGNMIEPPYATGPEIGSISTRNALNSGVWPLASPTGGVNELIGDAFLALPMKPKFSGSPI